MVPAIPSSRAPRPWAWPPPIGWASASQTLGRYQLALGFLLVMTGYYAGGIVGILLGFPPSGIAAIWPSTAILLAALLLAPPRYWWLYLLGAVPTHLLLVANFQVPEVPVVVMLCQVGSNVLHALIAALALRFVIGTPPRLDSLRNMAAFILLAGVATTAAACVVAVWLFLLTGWAADFWLAWRQRVLANVFAVITIPPVILLAFAGQLVREQHAPWRSYAELALITIGLLAVGIPVFGLESPGPVNVPALLLAPLPFLMWAAVRLGVGGTSLTLLIVAGMALASAFVGRGPFIMKAPDVNVFSLQIFLTAISIPLMLLAALVQERQRTEESLKVSEARMGAAAASTDTGLWQYDVPTGEIWSTEHCRSMFGLDANSRLRPQAFLAAVHADDRAVATAAMQWDISAGKTDRRSEFRVLHPSGELRWYLATAHTDFDEHGAPIRVSGIFRDVTTRRKAEEEAERLSERLMVLQDEERQRIAEELHDSTAQHLLAIGLNLNTLRSRVKAKGETVKLFEEIGSSLDETSKELRSFSYLLRPPRLESDGLAATLQRYLDGFSQRTGLKTTLRLNGSVDRVALPLQRAVLRIVQEALTNVHRHAAATSVSINLRFVGKLMHLVINDDGLGMEGASGGRQRQPIRLGVGVPGMRARIQQFGGKLEIRSGPKGTTVHAAVPVK